MSTKRNKEENEAQSVSKSFPGYLEAGDLDGMDVTVTISLVREPRATDLGPAGEPIDKPIVQFEGTEKEWVLNITNGRTIRALYGDKFPAWKGKKITIYPTSCMAWGERRACIRVRCVDPETGKEPDLF